MKTYITVFAIITFILSQLVGCGGSTPSGNIVVEPGDTISESIDAYLETNQSKTAPGLSILVRKDGELVYINGSGLANAQTQSKINKGTGFRLASVTKPFTALAVMKLVENGQLDLQNKIVEFIPDAPVAYRDITLLQLLTHQSGIPDYINDSDTVAHLDDLTSQQFISLAIANGDDELEFVPGTRGEYSNTGYVILADIIERVSGFSFPEFMHLEFFSPLGMNSSYVVNEHRGMGDLGEDVALSMAQTKDVFVIGRENETFNALIYGSSGIVTTVEDMNLFLQGLNEGLVVTADTLMQMIQPLSTLDNIGDYGLGWIIETTRNSNNGKYTSIGDYWHSGGYGGYRTILSISPEMGLEVVILSNGGDVTQPHTWNILELVRKFYQ